MLQAKPIKHKWTRFKYVFWLCVLLLVLFGIEYCMDFVFFYIFRIYDSLFYKIFYIVLHVVIFIVVIGVGLKDQRKTLASVCSFKKVNGNVWIAAVLCSVSFTLLNFYLTDLFYSFKYGWGNTDLGETYDNFLFNLINTAIIPAVAEEILFKGVIFTVLRKHFSVVSAVIITSLLFAGCHRELIRIVPLFVFSCYTFWLYLRSGSLVLPMILHFINNLFTFILTNALYSSRGTLYVALIIFSIGSYMLYSESKTEKALQKRVNDAKK